MKDQHKLLIIDFRYCNLPFIREIILNNKSLNGIELILKDSSENLEEKDLTLQDLGIYEFLDRHLPYETSCDYFNKKKSLFSKPPKKIIVGDYKKRNLIKSQFMSRY